MPVLIPYCLPISRRSEYSDNHDVVRFGDLLQRGQLAEPNESNYWDRHKAAYAFMAASTGPLTFFYGEEIGDEVPNFAAKVTSNCAIQGLCDDHVSRSPGKVEGRLASLGGLRSLLIVIKKRCAVIWLA